MHVPPEVRNHYFLFWLLPPLVFIVLMSGTIIVWRETRDLTFNLVSAQSDHAARQVYVKLDLLLYERKKDLIHLSSIWRNYPPEIRSEVFLRDASGIASREPSYYAISFINRSGSVVFETDSRHDDTLSPVTRVNVMEYLRKMAHDPDEAVISTPITTETGKKLVVLFFPVFSGHRDSLIFSGAIAGALDVSFLVQNVIKTSVPPESHVRMQIDDTLVYSPPITGPELQEHYSEQGMARVQLSAMNRMWQIEVYPPEKGILTILLRQNNTRLVLNTLASLLASVLLGLTLFAFFRSRQIRIRLQLSEEKYRRLAENAQDLIYRISIPEARYEYVSPAAEQLTGYTPREFYDNPVLIRTIIHPDWLDYFKQQWDNLNKGIAPPSYEYQIVTKTGETRWVNQRNVLIFDTKGKPVALEGIATDITSMVNTRQEREELIKELEKKNSDLERFTYTISHELRTPLITIKGFLGYLEEEATTGDFSKLHQDILRIIEATETMQRLLNDLIDLNRIGRVIREAEEINMAALVHSVLEHFSNQIMNRSIDITVASDMPSVIGFRKEIFELYQNLIENSIKFLGKQEKPEIKIGWKTNNDETIFFVKDNGIGFDPKYREKIFGLFNKLDSGTEGTGIGLTLVKRIIDHHGGWIRAESQGYSRGTTFYFTLPLSDRSKQSSSIS